MCQPVSPGVLFTRPSQFGVTETEGVLRCMWALVFSREEAVREAVVDAVYSLYLLDPPGEWVPPVWATRHTLRRWSHLRLGWRE